MHDGEMTLKEHWKLVKLLKDRYMQLSYLHPLQKNKAVCMVWLTLNGANKSILLTHKQQIVAKVAFQNPVHHFYLQSITFCLKGIDSCHDACYDNMINMSAMCSF